ncbi:MAG TPA: hypothetical protein VN428_05520 [Bryobacteraceae bacterium]|nr:hypothetical protein [Bryobacteraceae bacterium]
MRCIVSIIEYSSMRLYAASLLFLLAGCNDPVRTEENAAEVRVDSTVYHAPAAVRVRARNTGTVTWTTGMCGLRLQRQAATNWQTVAVSPAPGEGCDLAVLYVEPGGVLTRWINLSPGTVPGAYRVIVDDIHPELPEAARSSQTFQVAAQ